MPRTILHTGPKDSNIMIIGDSPSLIDSNYGVPFSGDVGIILNALLNKVGIKREECYITNVFKTRITSQKYGKEIDDPESIFAKNKREVTSEHVMMNSMMVKASIAGALECLQKEIEEVRPSVIIALGNVAMWSLTGEYGITDWRGSLEASILGPKIKVIPTVHPREMLYHKEWIDICISDFKRASRHRQSPDFPVNSKNICLGPSFEDVVSSLNNMLRNKLSNKFFASFDIENPGGYIDTIGISVDKNSALVIPFWDKDRMTPYWGAEEESEILFLLYKVMTHPNFHGICQNGNHERQYILNQWMFVPNVKSDTMINHHAMFPSEGDSANKKNLAFLSSIYCENYKYWKNKLFDHESQVEYWEYNAYDCMNTMEIYEEQIKRAEKSESFLQTIDLKNRLSETLFNLTLKGCSVRLADKKRAKKLVEGEILKIEEWIGYVLGFPINIGSPKQLNDLFYKYLGQAEIKKRVGKIWKASVTEEAISRIGQNEPLLRPLTSRIVKALELIKAIKVIDSIKLTKEGRLHCLFDVTGSIDDRIVVRETSFGYGGSMNNTPPLLKTMFVPDPGTILVEISVSPKFDFDGECNWEVSMGSFYMETIAEISRRSGLSTLQVSKEQKEFIRQNKKVYEFHNHIRSSIIGKGVVSNAFGRKIYVLGEKGPSTVKNMARWYVDSSVNFIINKIITIVDFVYLDLVFVDNGKILFQVSNEFSEKFKRYIDMLIVSCDFNRSNSFGLGYDVSYRFIKNNWGEINE